MSQFICALCFSQIYPIMGHLCYFQVFPDDFLIDLLQGLEHVSASLCPACPGTLAHHLSSHTLYTIFSRLPTLAVSLTSWIVFFSSFGSHLDPGKPLFLHRPGSRDQENKGFFILTELLKSDIYLP